MLFLGIHMAGPHLTAETFAGGMFNYPPTGNTNLADRTPVQLVLDGYLQGDTTPAISFGPVDNGGPVDFVAVDDFTATWWDPNAVGPDESGTVGKGLWQYVAFGLRFPLDNPKLPAGTSGDMFFHTMLSEVGGEMYETAKSMGIEDLPIAGAILDETPPLDVVPDYPPLPDSPAATGASG
jgi:hypothetical protein